MKFLHLSDIHAGKDLHGVSLMDDQRYIFAQIVEIATKEQPDAILIAGDIYDKSTPSAVAVSLVDWFFTALLSTTPHLFVLCGNHDSAERLAFGRNLMARAGLHLSPVYDGSIYAHTITDADGTTLKIHMLPYVRPVHVRAALPKQANAITSYTDAVRAALGEAVLDADASNILMAHQFVTGGVHSDSEIISVGGSDNVDADVFEGFDYVALGHLHSPQWVSATHIRYCGTPLKYSSSEMTHDKSVTRVTVLPDAPLQIDTIPLVPLRDVQMKKDFFANLMKEGLAKKDADENYYYIVLTDEEPVNDAMHQLRHFFPNVVQLHYDNTRTKACAVLPERTEEETQQPLDLFAALFAEQNGQPLNDSQSEFLAALIEQVWEEETV